MLWRLKWKTPIYTQSISGRTQWALGIDFFCIFVTLCGCNRQGKYRILTTLFFGWRPAPLPKKLRVFYFTKMERKGFIFYRGFRDAIAELSENDRIALMLAIIDYGLDGHLPDLAPMQKAIFMAFKPQLDANNRRYEGGQLGKEHGSKGGRPSKNPKETPKKPQENPKETPKEKDKDNAKDKDNVKDNAKNKYLLLNKEIIEKYEDAAYKWLHSKGGDTSPANIRKVAVSFYEKNPEQFTTSQAQPVPLYHRKLNGNG